MAWTYEATKAGYGNLWRTIQVKSKDADRFAKIIIKNEARYKAIEAKTGVPWFFVGVLHMRESSCDFAGVLHNGQKIIGRNKKTTIVPKGRGPFSSWEEAAVDALKLKGLEKIKAWPIERMGYESERYNGMGYANKGINSPYLWGGSNHQQPGKYIADHVWSATAMDAQMGTMTVIKRIVELRPDAMKGKPAFVSPPPDIEPVHRGAGLFASMFAAIAALFKRSA